MPDGTYPKTLTHHHLPPMTAHSPVEEEELASRGYAPVAVPEFSEYPLMMTHPDHEPAKEVSPAKYNTPDGAAPRGGGDLMAAARLHSYVAAVQEPERYPAVTVSNVVEEHQYATQGYIRGGASNQTAFSQAVAANHNPQSEAREVLQFPKWLTGPDGEAVLAKTSDEERALQKQWAKVERKRA